MSAALGDGVIAFASVVGTVCREPADLFTLGDLVEQVRQNRSIGHVASRNLDGAKLQCLLVDPEMGLMPDRPLWAAMFARVPFAHTLDLDPCTADKKAQRPLGAAIGNVHGKGLLATRQCAEVGHRPFKADQAQQALDKPGRLSQRHAEKTFIERQVRIANPPT